MCNIGFIEYASDLRALQPEIPATMANKDATYGNTPPTCYTDFEPHYNTKYLLEDIIVYNDGWDYSPGLENKIQEKKTYGYLDIRPMYIVSIVY